MEALDEEVRKLVLDLHTVQTTLKIGSLEREQKEDSIFQRLYEIAETIKTQYPDDPRMSKIYALIMPEEDKKSVVNIDKFPVYTDSFGMFTKTTTNPRLNFFISRMAEDLKVGTPEQIHNHLSNPHKDGSKEILQSLWSNVHRPEWLKSSARDTCKSCWNTVMHRVFFMMAEVVTAEMRTRAHQVISMTQQGQLTLHDAKDLSLYIENVVKKIEELLDHATKKTHKHKEDLVNLVEALFRLMINTVNEIMMRYVKLLHFKNSVKNMQMMEQLSA